MVSSSARWCIIRVQISATDLLAIPHRPHRARRAKHWQWIAPDRGTAAAAVAAAMAAAAAETTSTLARVAPEVRPLRERGAHVQRRLVPPRNFDREEGQTLCTFTARTVRVFAPRGFPYNQDRPTGWAAFTLS